MALIFLLSLSFCLILMPLLKSLSRKWSLVDVSGDDPLKIHQTSIPFLGGLGIFLSILLIIFVLGLFRINFYPKLFGFILAGFFALLIGLWDDLKWKKKGNPYLKFLCQITIIFLSIFILDKYNLVWHLFSNEIFNFLFLAIYFLIIINAINMEDGLDGLASGLTIISLIGFLIISLLASNNFIFLLSVLIIGPIVGFLIFNWRPASIFLGDNGSHFLGFCLVVLTMIVYNETPHSFLKFITLVLIVGMPVIDLIWVVFNRIRKGKSPFLGDRSHLYDKIKDGSSFSVPGTVLIYCLLQAIIVATGLIIFLRFK
jgi:UDP-GlcNAc:undecaprenyl-phosphate/decaprenyl-phosphate GlcNAc-1-phosphate transferase